MAPMVAATFSYFHWSSCSAGEYHYKVGNLPRIISQHFVPQSDEWKCLRNKPKKGGNYTLITEKIEYEYSLDDQVSPKAELISNICHSVEWSLTVASPFAAAFNCQTHVNTCGAPIR